MTAWKCEICGYIHNAEDPPGFCPVCGASQDLFSVLLTRPETPAPVAAGTWQCGICDYKHRGAEPPGSCPVCSAPGTLFEPLLDESTDTRCAAEIRRVVIVGAGIAGVTAAGEARRQAPDVKITLLSREPAPP